jgi:cytochrome c biogenesis protein
LLKAKNILWSFFSSVKLTIFLLVLLVLFFIAATFIPQPDTAQKIVWLTDLYHSPLFYILVGLLSFNLIICSLNRFPTTMKQYKALYFPEPPGLFDNLPQNQIIITDKEVNVVTDAVESGLASKFGRVKKMATEKGHLFYREQGRLSLFGVYIVHLSILIMIAGAVLGSIFGLEGELNIKEGETAGIVQLTKGRGMHQLDFSVRCDKFIVEFYDNGAPKTYRSDLSFIKDGRVMKQGSVLVNHPLMFEGLRFYQSSYGTSLETKAVLTYKTAGKKSGEIMVTKGDTFILPEQNARVTVLRVEESIMQLGPAVKLSISSPKKNIQLWIFKHIDEIAAANPGLLSEVPLFNPGLFKPLVFSLNRIEQQYYTGLRVVRDPGILFVLTGGMLLLAGMILIFFILYQRVWVRVEQIPEGVKISVAGQSNHNNAELQRQIDNLCVQIGQELKA